MLGNVLQCGRRAKGKVYICSPLRGDVKGNIEKCKEYCRCVYKQTKGHMMPIAPHLYFTQFLDDNAPSERKYGIQCGIDILSKCDELWVIGDKVSEGMAEEIRIAARERIPIRWFIYSFGVLEERERYNDVDD